MNLTGTAAPVSIRLARIVLLATVAAMILALLGPAVPPAVAHTRPGLAAATSSGSSRSTGWNPGWRK
mgnify:CR=1 FL=1